MRAVLVAAALCLAAFPVSESACAPSLMHNNNSDDLTWASVWHRLDDLIARESETDDSYFYCPSEQYCEWKAKKFLPQLALASPPLFPELKWDDLVLPRNMSILAYGHSYLRNVIDNVFAVNAPELSASYAFVFPSVPGSSHNPNPKKNSVNAQFCPDKFIRPATKQLMPGVPPPVHGAAVSVFAELGTILVTVMNDIYLQNPDCETALHQFLETDYLPRFDAVLYMQPHGAKFNEYLAKKFNNETITKADHHVDLDSMTGGGLAVSVQRLGEIFRKHSRRGASVINVFPWVKNASDSFTATSSRANASIKLNDFVHFSSAVPVCTTARCTSKTTQHQCNPGTPTLAAAALMRLVKPAAGATNAAAAFERQRDSTTRDDLRTQQRSQ